MNAKRLEGRVAVVAGATRGAGRGIAVSLGEAGATVYGTGRSQAGRPSPEAERENRPETIEETAEMVREKGGVGIAVPVDHTDPEQVQALFERVREERGRVDILVNDIWGGDALTDWGKPLWEHSLDDGFTMIQRAVGTHIITSHYGIPLMLETGGLLVEITDGDHLGFRGNFFYDLVKSSVIRLAFSLAKELKKTQVTALALTSGYLRSEAMLDHFGVTEDNWKVAGEKEPDFLASETPYFVGRAVAALAFDKYIHEKAGRVFNSGALAHEYGFTDVDGRQPYWNQYFEKTNGMRVPVCDDAFYHYWENGPMEAVFPDS